MKKKYLLFLSLILIIVLALVLVLGPGQSKGRSDAPKINGYFAKKMNRADLIGLQVASIGNGELVWQGSYGLKVAILPCR